MTAKNTETEGEWNFTAENTSARLEYFGNGKDETVSVYIGNIPDGLDEEGLFNLLLSFGGQPPVKIHMPERSDKGIAFAEFKTISAVTKVIQDLNDRPPLYLRVQVARKQGRQEAEKFPPPTFAAQLKRPPSDYERPTTWAVGRGALRRSTAVHRAYKSHVHARPVNDSSMWSTGPGDIYDAHKYRYMHAPRNDHEQVNRELVTTLQMSSKSDGRRTVAMGRGYYVYPKKKPTAKNGPGPAKQYYDNVSQGVYSHGKDIQVPSIPCVFCGIPTVKKCLECLSAYCSEDCQTRDWNKHRTQCKVNVCVDVAARNAGGERRIISLTALSEPIPTEVPSTGACTSVRSTACVIDVMRQHMLLDGILQITKCSRESKAVYGPLCSNAASAALSKLVVDMPAHFERSPPLSSFSPEKGAMVGVRDKDSWWRGLVLHPSHKFDEYRVGLVELAEVVTAKRCDLRPLPPAFAALPEFGIRGTVLTSLVQDDDLWSTYLQVQKDLHAHAESAEGATITCLVKSKDDVNVCRMRFERWDPAAQLGNSRVVTLTPKCRAVIVSYHDQFAIFLHPMGKQHNELRNTVLQQVAASHVVGSPLDRPPRRDEMVACKCELDGSYYRAVVMEASSEQAAKYKVWFVDFGNVADVGLEDMRILPQHVKNYPFLAVKVALSGIRDNKLTAAAVEFLNGLVDREEVLKVEFENSIESGVELQLRDGNYLSVELNTRLQPSWIIAARNNKNLYEDKVLMLDDLVPLPLIEDERSEAAEVAVIILHVNADEGAVLCCPADSPVVPVVATSLTAQINEFCDSPYSANRYNPRKHEICLARHQDGSWQRALSVESIEGGSRVVFLDFGGTHNVLFRDIRRIIPDFMTMPTLISSCLIQDLPSKLSDAVKSKLKELIKQNTIMRLQNVKAKENSVEYEIHMPQVINALRAEELI